MIDPWIGDPRRAERAKAHRAFFRTWGVILAAAALTAWGLPPLLRSTGWFGVREAPLAPEGRPALPANLRTLGLGLKVEGGVTKNYRFTEKDGRLQIVVEEIRPSDEPERALDPYTREGAVR